MKPKYKIIKLELDEDGDIVCGSCPFQLVCHAYDIGEASDCCPLI